LTATRSPPDKSTTNRLIDKSYEPAADRLRAFLLFEAYFAVRGAKEEKSTGIACLDAFSLANGKVCHK
jgi:hypothetical protein